MVWQELSSIQPTVSVMLSNLDERMTDEDYAIRQRLEAAHLREPHAGDLGALGQLPQLAHPGLEQRPPGLLVVRRLHAVHKFKCLSGGPKTRFRQDMSATAQATSA